MSVKNKIQKIRFITFWDGNQRADYLKKHNILAGIGENCLFQSRNFPMDPKLLKLHDNVTVAANVHFVTHDAIRHVLFYKYHKHFARHLGCIEVMDNVFIGLGSIIMPNVKIGENCVIGGGSIVTKDIPANSVAVGVPAKVIGTFDDLVKKRGLMTPEEEKMSQTEIIAKCWKDFEKTRS